MAHSDPTRACAAREAAIGLADHLDGCDRCGAGRLCPTGRALEAAATGRRADWPAWLRVVVLLALTLGVLTWAVWD